MHALTSTVSSVYPQRLLDHARPHHAARGQPRPIAPPWTPWPTPCDPSWSSTSARTRTSASRGSASTSASRPTCRGRSTCSRRWLPTATTSSSTPAPARSTATSTCRSREDAAVNPISPYSVSKYAGERYCRMFFQGTGWPLVMVRPFNTYGPAQSPDRIIPEIIVRALRGQPLKMTQGRQTREFNYVDRHRDRLPRCRADAGEPRAALQHRLRRGGLDARPRHDAAAADG